MRPAPIALLFALLFGAACQSAGDASVETEDSFALTEESAPSAPMPARESFSGADGGSAGGAIPIAEPPPGGAPAVGRELVRTGTVVLRAENHAEAVERTREWTRLFGGSVTGEESARRTDRVETTLTLRVPAARFDTLMTILSTLPGQLDRRAVTVDDVTRPVADTEARLRVRRAAEERLLDLLDDAEAVDDVLAVQTRLDAVREEIESAEAILRTLRADVALSTIHATLYEASAAGLGDGPGFGERVRRAVAGGWDGLLGTFLVVAALWPLWLGLGAALWAVGLLRRRRMRRRAAPAASPQAATWQ